MTRSTDAFSRRQVLTGSLASLAATGLPWSNVALAAAPTDRRLVVILLRGGLDGLSLFPPYGDRYYQEARGPLAIRDAIELNDFYGLHPAADALLPFWARDELLLFPASAPPYHGTDHKAAQSVLDGGGPEPGRPSTGWLNRVLESWEGPSGLAAQHNIPFILQGPTEVDRWQADRLKPLKGLRERLDFINETDPVLAHALALTTRQHQNDRDNLPHAASAPGSATLTPFDQATIATYIGRNLASENGARLAVMECAGWDMHYRQGAETGRQARRFTALSASLENLAAGLGSVWNKTVVVVASEFGRTVSPNAWKGTDNGGATATLVIGGAVKGGRTLGKWPGLSPDRLRDGALAPTIDTRSIFKAVLAEHLKLSAGRINKTIFPDSNGAKAISGLMRSP